MTARRLSIPATISCVLAAIALWVTLGALTALSTQPSTPRIAFTPSWLWLAGLLAGAVLLAGTAARRRPEAWLLCLSAIVLLPWLPFRIPRVFLAWTGPLRTWLWLMIGASMAASLARSIARHRSVVLRSAGDPARAPWIAAAVAAALYAGGAWMVSPHLPAGDEPHYLVIAQSLLRDHDLKIENNHRRGDYREYFGGELRPDYLRRGTDGEIYSIHPVGLPAIIAPVFAVAGYPGALAFLALLSALATALTWRVVWRLTHDAASAWFAWAATGLSVPFFFQAFTVYPDAPGGALVMIGFLALFSERALTTRQLVLTGAALSVLPWLHTRFAIIEAALLALLLLRLWTPPRALSRVAALLVAPALGGLAWLGFFYIVYGTPNPAAPYNGYTQSEIGNLARGVPGLLFDQQFGLLPNAPVYVCSTAGFWTLFRRQRRVALSILFVVLPYVLATAMYAMWWAGYSSPARFLVAILLPLAVPTGVWFSALRSRSARLLACGALAVSLLMTVTVAAVDRGALLFNVRDGASLLLRWLSPSVDLTTGLPSLFRTGPTEAVRDAAIWLIAIAAVVFAGRALERRRSSPAALAAMVGFAAVAAASAALSIVWRTNAAEPVTLSTGGAALLRRFDPDNSPIAIRYAPFARLPPSALPPAITLARVTPGERRPDEGLILLRDLPAATYEIEALFTQPAAGGLTATLDRQFGAAWAWSVDGVRGPWRQTINVPVPVPALLIDASAMARESLQYVRLRAISVPGRQRRVATGEPLHVVRYGPAVVFLMSGHAYTEPGGTWIGGGESADFVVSPDPGTPIRLFVRNAPVRNQITIDSGEWRQVLTLEPREERLLDVPLGADLAGTRIRVACASGARPSDFEATDDRRLLGCWIETR